MYKPQRARTLSVNCIFFICRFANVGLLWTVVCVWILSFFYWFGIFLRNLCGILYKVHIMFPLSTSYSSPFNWCSWPNLWHLAHCDLLVYCPKLWHVAHFLVCVIWFTSSWCSWPNLWHVALCDLLVYLPNPWHVAYFLVCVILCYKFLV